MHRPLIRSWLPLWAVLVLYPFSAFALTYEVASPGTSVIGEVLFTESRKEDTLLDIARIYDVGYEEIRLANPKVDPWLPGEDTRIRIPTLFVLPDAPREGLVINLAEKRLYYYPPPDSPNGGAREVITHPISIGREGWETPLGTTRIIRKDVDPVWTPPQSIKDEHAEKGDPLPDRVLPGPDNPLGSYALRLGFAGYLIHGTNKPYGIGMEVSHGCIRMMPEDIESLFAMIPIGTKVHIVDQPFKAGWRGDVLYLEVHPKLRRGNLKQTKWLDLSKMVQVLIKSTQEEGEERIFVDWSKANEIAKLASGIPEPTGKRLQDGAQPKARGHMPTPTTRKYNLLPEWVPINPATK